MKTPVETFLGPLTQAIKLYSAYHEDVEMSLRRAREALLRSAKAPDDPYWTLRNTLEELQKFASYNAVFLSDQMRDSISSEMKELHRKIQEIENWF